MHTHTLNQLTQEVIPKLKEYIEKAHISTHRNLSGLLTVSCPACGQSEIEIVDNSNWKCSECCSRGNVITYAKALHKLSSDDQALREVCRCLKIPFPFLCTTTATDLMNTKFKKQEAIIEGMLAPGLYILAGAPKLGKSWLALQTAVSISSGQPLWNRSTYQSEVLYLALEDSAQRIQERLRMLCTKNSTSNENIYFAYDAPLLGHGLEDQVTEFLKHHPKTRLVIIDTLGRAKGDPSSRYNYFEDYALISTFKNIASIFSTTILLVHHTRKQESNDCMAMISGTTGLFGAADGAMVLIRPDRLKGSAILSVSGKDFPDCRLELHQNPATMQWELCEGICNQVTKEAAIIEAVITLLKNHNRWEGTATELLNALTAINPQIKTAPNALIRKLNDVSEILEKRESISFLNERDGNEKIKVLEQIPQ